MGVSEERRNLTASVFDWFIDCTYVRVRAVHAPLQNKDLLNLTSVYNRTYHVCHE